MMCSSKCANLHVHNTVHFPGRAVAYAASICWALNYDLSLYTIPSDLVQMLQSRL
jgi:hypothetical protein